MLNKRHQILLYGVTSWSSAIQILISKKKSEYQISFNYAKAGKIMKCFIIL